MIQSGRYLGGRQVCLSVVVFSVTISLIVCLLARSFMSIFVEAGSHAIIQAGITYLRIEGAFYIGIGILFLLYGYYRAVNKPVMSVSVITHSGDRSDRNLGFDTDWLVLSRPDRNPIL